MQDSQPVTPKRATALSCSLKQMGWHHFSLLLKYSHCCEGWWERLSAHTLITFNLKVIICTSDAYGTELETAGLNAEIFA